MSTRDAQLRTMQELEEAMEPLSADAEALVAGHIEALTVEAAKVPGLEATAAQLEEIRQYLTPEQQRDTKGQDGWRGHVFSAIDTERDLVERIAERLPSHYAWTEGPAEVVDYLAGRVEDVEQERDGALEAVRNARSTLAVLTGTHSISEHAYQELACHLADEPLGADGERITTRAERAESERDALKARLDQVGNAVQVGVEYDVANRDAAREQVADLSAENAALVAERAAAEARVKELTAALEHEVVQWSGDRSWCRRCRTEQPQVPSPRVPHQHADRCPLAGASSQPPPATAREVEQAMVEEAWGVVEEAGLERDCSLPDALRRLLNAASQRAAKADLSEAKAWAKFREVKATLRMALERVDAARMALHDWDQTSPSDCGFTGAGVEGFAALTSALRDAFLALRPVTAPTLGLIEAVGAVARWADGLASTFDIHTPDTHHGAKLGNEVLTLGHLRALAFADREFATLDAAKGPQDDVAADLRRILELARTGSHVGDTATDLGEKAVQAVRALHGDSQKWWTAKARGEDRAELARVIDVEAEELGVTIAYQSLTSLACAVGSHIIGDDGTEPAATVSKARLVDVLRTRRDAARGSEDRAREWDISRLRAHHAGARDMAEAIAQDLHLTLDTSPSGPKPEPEDRQFEAWAQGQREADARRYEWVRARRASPPVAPKSSTPLLLAKNPVNSTPVPAAARPPCRPTPLPDVPGLAQEPIVDTAALARAMSEPDAPGEDEGHG